MATPNDTDPARFITDFYAAMNRDLLETDEDAGAIIDRYHTPEIVQFFDGRRMDREKLVSHLRPVRKNRPHARMDVHEAYAEGDRLAARYTLHVQDRKRTMEIEVYFFGRFASDGRMVFANGLTRTIRNTRHQDAEPAPETNAEVSA